MLIRRIIIVFAIPADTHNKGALLVHTVAVVSFIFFIKLIILNGAIKRDTGDLEASETLSLDHNTQTLALTNELQDTLFYQVADSVHVKIQ